mgnify:CR=1 FL=1
MSYKRDIILNRRKRILIMVSQKIPQREIAERLGVSRSCVAKVVASYGKSKK